jgi:hypothetical protein
MRVAQFTWTLIDESRGKLGAPRFPVGKDTTDSDFFLLETQCKYSYHTHMTTRSYEYMYVHTIPMST